MQKKESFLSKLFLWDGCRGRLAYLGVGIASYFAYVLFILIVAIINPFGIIPEAAFNAAPAAFLKTYRAVPYWILIGVPGVVVLWINFVNMVKRLHDLNLRGEIVLIVWILNGLISLFSVFASQIVSMIFILLLLLIPGSGQDTDSDE